MHFSCMSNKQNWIIDACDSTKLKMLERVLQFFNDSLCSFCPSFLENTFALKVYRSNLPKMKLKNNVKSRFIIVLAAKVFLNLKKDEQAQLKTKAVGADWGDYWQKNITKIHKINYYYYSLKLHFRKWLEF